MLGRQSGSQPLSLVDGFLGRPWVRKGSIYHLVVHAGIEEFEDVAIAKMCAEKGRPSYAPSLMLRVLLLAFHDKAADAEGEECCRHDPRWKYALGCGVREDARDATTICRFRARPIANEQAGSAFLCTRRWARERGAVGDEVEELVESTAVFGAGAVFLRKARRQLARRLIGEAAHAEWAKGVLAEPDHKPDTAWDDRAARQKMLNTLVVQCQEAPTPVQGGELTAEQQGARELLQAVVEQHIEVDPDEAGGVHIRQGVGKDRVCSATEPERRLGHETSSGGSDDGHKAEIGMDPVAELIVDAETMAGNGGDGAHLAERMAGVEAATEVDVVPTIGGTAYALPAVRAEMQPRGTAVLASVPAPQNRGLLTKGSSRRRTAAAARRGPKGRARIRQAGELAEVAFQPKTSVTCPLRARRTTGKRQGRTVGIRADEAGYGVLRMEQEREACRQGGVPPATAGGAQDCRAGAPRDTTGAIPGAGRDAGAVAVVVHRRRRELGAA